MEIPIIPAVCLYMIVYYGIVLYTMLKFYNNACRCKKMEGYKKTWNYYYIVGYSLLSFVYGIYVMTLTVQQGGSSKNSIMIFLYLLILQVPAYLNDYAVLSLFGRMKEEGCPFTTYWRDLVQNMTYVRIVLSFVVLYKRYIDFRTLRKISRRNLIRK